MLFNSYPFIFVFLPLLLLGIHLLSRGSRREVALWFLVVASLCFYGWWNWHYLFLFGFSIAFNFTMAEALRPSSRWQVSEKARQRFLIIAFVGNVLLLGYFKYRNFFLQTADSLGAHWQLSSLILPLAISFFTFEQITYVMSAWRGEVGENDFLTYCLFITFFPHLIAGPIVRYGDIAPQLNRRTRIGIDADDLSTGLMIFAIGLFKKVILADTLRPWVGMVFDSNSLLSFGDAWGGAISFALEIYFDFSGYTDMAIGLARMVGVRFTENFDSPYKAASVIDFWRRWHMTLSYFLRDYVYIPLGGNRHGELRQHLNLFLTMLIGGLWHGANWTFVVWGAVHGVMLSINHAWRRMGLKLPEWAGWMLTFTAVVSAFVIFRAGSFSLASGIL